MSRLTCGVALGLALASSGCELGGDASSTEPPPVPPPVLSGALVSEPLSSGALVAAQAGVVYVSLPPGSYPGGLQATIRNPANGGKEVVTMVEGGWDPVSIAAESGDTLRITITTEEGGTVEYANAVPPIYRPVIVRTDPPPRKRDVPLNVVMLVVFSEPIDPATVTPQRVQLLRDGQPVDAEIELSADGLRMTVRPVGELAPSTEYLLVVSPELSDRTGDRLATSTEVEFTTASADGRGVAFMRGTNVLVSDLNGSMPVVLATGATRPAWSPDGTRLAFARPPDNSVTRWRLCIAEADGTGVRCATGAEDGDVVVGPSWSPDGAKVAFSVRPTRCGDGDCIANFSRLLLLDSPTMQVETLATEPVNSMSWSPDGRKIAIVLSGVGTRGAGALGTVNADGSGLEILAMSFGRYSVAHVAWSPAGARLALILWDEYSCPWWCDTALGIVNADGTELRLVDWVQGSLSASPWTPAVWSPDGAQVAYTVSRDVDCSLGSLDCHAIAIVRVDGAQKPSLLLSNAAYPSWRP